LFEREEQIPAPDGMRTFLCRRFPIYDRNGCICGVGSIATDITRRKRAQAQLRKFEDLFHHAEWGIALAGSDGETNEMVNLAYARMHGYSPEELIGKPFVHLYPPELREFAAEQVRITYALGRNTFETVRMRKDGSTFPALITSMAVRNSDGQVLYGAATVQDLTAQKRATQAIQEKEAAEKANRELEAFSYSVAHDLRSPLHVIGGFSRVLMKEYGDRLDHKGKTYLNYLSDSAQRMAQTIEDLLALSGVSHHDLRRARVDLTAVARGVAARLQSSMPQRKVEFLIAEGLEADCDPRLIAVVLENLLGNAWKFTRKREAARIEFGVRPESHPPVFFVRDNGAGFDMAQAGKLFTAFQRLHSGNEFEGTGIGLSTVHRIIQRHGGRIWAQGAIDQGAEFHFTLDTHHPAQATSRASAS
jgi:PAS domain S-box-containing protein